MSRAGRIESAAVTCCFLSAQPAWCLLLMPLGVKGSYLPITVARARLSSPPEVLLTRPAFLTDKERLIEMLRAMKQRALSAAMADSVTNSARDSPAISLSGKGRTSRLPATCSSGHRVRGGTQKSVFTVNLTYWKLGFSPSFLCGPPPPSCWSRALGHNAN